MYFSLIFIFAYLLVILFIPLHFQKQLFVYRFKNQIPLVYFLLGFYNSYSAKHTSPTFQNLKYCVTAINEMTNTWISFLLQGMRVSFALSFEVDCHFLKFKKKIKKLTWRYIEAVWFEFFDNSILCFHNS